MSSQQVTTSFPGGNGINFDWLGTDRLCFAADLRDGPCSMWFHFLVENPVCDVLHCELTNGLTALGWPYRPYVRPVFRHPGGSWRRTPPTVINAQAGRFAFDVECKGRTTEIASCYPYQLMDWESFFSAVLRPAAAEIVPLGATGMGRPYFACRLGQGSKLLWVAARAHAGETPGSYVLEGLLAEFAAAHDPSFTVLALPFLDLDGVAEGMYGKNRPPIDFNRAWHVEQTRPEIKACRDLLEKLPAPPVLAVDLHAPTAYDSHFICHSPTLLVPGRAALLASLVEDIAKESEGDPAVALDRAMTGAHLAWSPQGEEHTQSGHFKMAYGALAFTAECAYHATHLGAEVGPAPWRKLGKILARNIRTHLSVT